MSLVIAYTNFSNTTQQSHQSSHAQAKSRYMRRTARMFKIGTKVVTHGAYGTVVGYNIADFGRWLAISHPIMVRLDNDEIIYAKLSDLAERVGDRPFF
jgi:hypothetical protein